MIAWKKLEFNEMPQAIRGNYVLKSLSNWTLPYFDTIQSVKDKIDQLLKEKNMEPNNEKWANLVSQATEGNGQKKNVVTPVTDQNGHISVEDSNVVELLVVRLAIVRELQRNNRGGKEGAKECDGK